MKKNIYQYTRKLAAYGLPVVMVGTTVTSSKIFDSSGKLMPEAGRAEQVPSTYFDSVNYRTPSATESTPALLEELEEATPEVAAAIAEAVEAAQEAAQEAAEYAHELYEQALAYAEEEPQEVLEWAEQFYETIEGPSNNQTGGTGYTAGASYTGATGAGATGSGSTGSGGE